MNTQTPLRNQAMLEQGYMFDTPAEEDGPIIKVIGVGGGGSNAVKHMVEMQIKDVEFAVCNTDRQALIASPVKTKLQLGKRNDGAGMDFEVGRQAAEESIEDPRHLLGGRIRMLFITAGMGGGTGTGAAPVVAKLARDMGLLTVAVVTAPYKYEGTDKKEQALKGIEMLKQSCDTVLVVLNDKLAELYGNLGIRKAFAHADNVLANAVKSIAEIITTRGDVNTDFEDVKRVLQGAGQSVMGSADAEGEDRAIRAIEEALNSPLLNDRDIRGAKRILLTISSSTEHEATLDEQTIISDFILDKIGSEARLFKLGAIFDDNLGAKMRVTVIAAGFELPENQKDFPGPGRRVVPIKPVLEPEPQPQDEPDVVVIDETEPATYTSPASGPFMDAPDDVLVLDAPEARYPEPSVTYTEPARPKDDEQVRRMIDRFVSTPDRGDLDSPTYLRHRVVLYDLPKMPDHEVVRSRLSD